MRHEDAVLEDGAGYDRGHARRIGAPSRPKMRLLARNSSGRHPCGASRDQDDGGGGHGLPEGHVDCPSVDTRELWVAHAVIDAGDGKREGGDGSGMS